ncbi:PulJ/GspJ family protein [Aquimarina brevivitae]|uniref:Prepilin-type N-terminal cleavage/methylation domain-containing protein n=1 Tax=Aquimarina brevivitae TaxID=323412 RepID=A0A4Q7PGE1_9FLAO|nr:prepilin-type N-terminal cleavage/methylation domain-containing protein [Aquimarina brevivitae]RZS98810.1 prepilin-type N-terminal cleavage/methylation domain-containing protein [Aquimarina brevivitae]
MVKHANKIKSFTLTEMMVVLVISAIVVGLAFTILSIVQKNMVSIEQNYSYATELTQLEVALTADMNSCTQVAWIAKEDKLQFSSPVATRSYRFYQDSIVSDINTFKVAVKEKSFFLEGKDVASGSIDAIKLEFDKTTKEYCIFVYRKNDPAIHF